MADLEKEVYSVNELNSLNNILDSANDFLVGWEEDDNLKITGFVFNVADKAGLHVGAVTRMTGSREVQFEPGFRADI